MRLTATIAVTVALLLLAGCSVKFKVVTNHGHHSTAPVESPFTALLTLSKFATNAAPLSLNGENSVLKRVLSYTVDLANDLARIRA